MPLSGFGQVIGRDRQDWASTLLNIHNLPREALIMMGATADKIAAALERKAAKESYNVFQIWIRESFAQGCGKLHSYVKPKTRVETEYRDLKGSSTSLKDIL
eukprot:3388420-Pyramimonas_sp.AAC.1